MCIEHVLTYAVCKHEESGKKYCRAAKIEIEKVQKGTTWCCIPIPRKRRIVCDVEFKTSRDDGLCDHCKAARRREHARQVREGRAKSQQQRKADQEARDRERNEIIEKEEARAQARKAAERYGWKSREARQAEGNRPTGNHGDSFIDEQLYEQIFDMLETPLYLQNVPEPKASGGNREHSGNKLKTSGPVTPSGAREDTRRAGEKSGRVPHDPTRATRPDGTRSRKGKEQSGHKRRGPAQAPAPGPVAPATVSYPKSVHHRTTYRKHEGSEVFYPAPNAASNGGTASRNQVVQGGGMPYDEYGEPLPDDDFLDYVERYEHPGRA